MLAILMTACKSTGNQPSSFGKAAKPEIIKIEENGKYYRGAKKLTESKTLSLTDLNQQMAGKTEIRAKLKSDVESVCKVKGCWMNLQEEGTEPMRVMFKDYAFFVPLDCEGKQAIVEGRAFLDTTSVADLRHYAEDAGATAEEIAKITEPKVEIAFEAESVMIKEK